MEVIFLPVLVFVFVVVAIVLFYRLSSLKEKAAKSWQSYQTELKKRQQLPGLNDHLPDAEMEKKKKDYNRNAHSYNRLINKFPTSLMAAMAGYQEREIITDDGF